MTDENLLGWDEDRLLEEIRDLLPAKWGFKFAPHARGFWTADFHNAERNVVWEEASPAANLLLYSAYGWLSAQVRPQPKVSSNWVRRRELTHTIVAEEANKTPDPPHLDPNEVAAVYESHCHKHGR